VTEDEFHREFNPNVLGPLLMIREVVSHFGPSSSNIINIGSASSQLNPPNQSIYTATKGALDVGCAAFELSISTPLKMLAVGRFDSPAQLETRTWAASQVTDSITEPLSSPIHKEREEVIANASSIPLVYKQPALQSSAAPRCLLFLLLLRCARRLAKAIADSRRSTADRRTLSWCQFGRQ
jgi:hypothetical protein